MTVRVVVFPHDLEMGGSQLNAIEIAAAVRELGVETTVFGRPGALNARIAELGLDFVESPRPHRRPTPSLVAALRSTAARRGASVLHGYEWPPSLECYLATIGRPSTVAVSTVMSMAVAPFVPRTMPLVVGTEQIAHAERAGGRPSVEVLEPPVDLAHNGPRPAAEVEAFRRAHGVEADEFLVVCVGRLAHELKAEGLRTAIAAVGDLPPGWRTRLLVVGDGPARPEIEIAAEAANHAAGRQVVVLTGQLMDPRTAYAAADAVLGMGGSALRALAYAKPLIVQGERGFFALLEPSSAAIFFWQGWYGVGRDPADGPAAFTETVRRLVHEPRLREEVSTYGDRLVRDRFSLAAAARRQVDIYEAAWEDRAGTGRLLADAASALPALASYKSDRTVRRVLRRGAADDFNNKPVAATQTPPPEQGSPPGGPPGAGAAGARAAGRIPRG